MIQLPMRRISILLIASYVILVNTLIAQNPVVDSLQEVVQLEIADSLKFVAYKDLAWHYRRIHLDSAIMYNDMALENLQSVGSMSALADINYQYGVLHRYKGAFDISTDYFQKVLDYRIQTADTTGIAKVYYAIAVVKAEAQEFDEGVEIALKSLDYFKLVDHGQGQIRAYNVLGNLFKDSGRDSTAIVYFKEGIKVGEPLGLKMDVANLYGNIGSAFVNVKNYDEALHYYDKAMKIDEEENSLWGVGMILHNKALIYIEQKRYKDAEANLKRSLNIKQDMGHIEDAALVSAMLGYVMSENGQYAEGLKLLKESLAFGEREQLGQVTQEALSYTALAHESQQQYFEANEYNKKYNTYMNELREANVDAKFLELQTKYEAKEKAIEIELLNAENEITNLQLATASRRNLFLGTMCLLFGGLLFTMYRMYKKIKEQNKIKDVLLREIHHRVKNNLQVISSLLNLQSKNISNPEAKEAILLGKTRVHSMSLIHQDLYKEDNLTGIEMNKYLVKLSNDLFSTYNISQGSIALETDIDNIQLDVETVIPIGLIVNELISNSLKYAFPEGQAGHISVSLKEQQGKLQLKVEDDGIGFDEAKLLARDDQSFGHFMIDIFKHKLGAELLIDGSQGTKVDLRIGTYKLAS